MKELEKEIDDLSGNVKKISNYTMEVESLKESLKNNLDEVKDIETLKEDVKATNEKVIQALNQVENKYSEILNGQKNNLDKINDLDIKFMLFEKSIMSNNKKIYLFSIITLISTLILMALLILK